MTDAERPASRRYRARRDALRGLRAALGSEALGGAMLGSAGKWTNADQYPASSGPAFSGPASSDVRTKPVVVASTDVDTSQAVTFAAFTDPVVYSRWLGVPVTLSGGRFACTMEWGTNVRGRYELVCPPELIVMSWDFEDDNIPVPGGEMTGYLRIQPLGQEPPAGRGAPTGQEPPADYRAHVEVHQLVDTPAQAAFMEGAWAMVLGRLKAGVARASNPAEPMPPRPARPKHTPATTPGELRPA